MSGGGGDTGGHGSAESHGVYRGTPREDGKMQDEPAGADNADEQEWAEHTESGGEVT